MVNVPDPVPLIESAGQPLKERDKRSEPTISLLKYHIDFHFWALDQGPGIWENSYICSNNMYTRSFGAGPKAFEKIQKTNLRSFPRNEGKKSGFSLMPDFMK